MDLCVRRTPASDWEPRSPDVQAPGPSLDHTTAAQPPALNHRTRGRGWGRGAEAWRCRHAAPKRSQAPPGDAGLTAALAPRTGKAPAPRGDARASRQRAEQTRPAVQSRPRTRPLALSRPVNSASSPPRPHVAWRRAGVRGVCRDPNRGDPRPLRRWTTRTLSASCCGSECLGQGDRTQSPAPIEPNLYPRQPGSGARGWRADTGRGDGSGSEG